MSKWRVTMNKGNALFIGYIGETTVLPTLIADAVHRTITGRALPRWHQFYCGEQDDYLSKKFGYST